MESKGVVIDIVEKKGKLLAAFNTHDGVFRLPADDAEMRRKLEESRDRKSEVVFQFRDDMTLVCVGKPASPAAPQPKEPAGVTP